MTSPDPPTQDPAAPEPHATGSLWEQARSTCTACGAVGLLDEGYLSDMASGGHIAWIGKAHTGGMFGGAWFGVPKLLVRAFRCRECRHLELFAEDPE
ncbi:hypothetical protein [Serinicoccus kebangsaanensis]|uniref:hypothetical protein n=1 Tax=Serinicoccus kebangsaanensis TaxID=2602069 RepID=UPI00192D2CA1|nr:hypothetical protein [Serinicoccus kebangsaanensis]